MDGFDRVRGQAREARRRAAAVGRRAGHRGLHSCLFPVPTVNKITSLDAALQSRRWCT
uniref:Uncharacterized protein n=1 Tax=Setaria viridis TaxID=4556 RepID=A0A4U6T9S7_SETVI|nr:hypothetical protein SEVIR_9G502301v2 [Setaria viridis]